MLAACLKGLWAPALAGGVLTVLLAAARPLTRRVFGPNWHYYSWLCVLAVLVLPVRVLLPSGGADAELASIQAVGQAAPAAIQPHLAAVPAIFVRDWLSGNWQTLLGAVWLFGALACLVWRLLKYGYLLYTVRKNTTPIDCPAIARYTRRHVRVRQAPGQGSPYLVGLVRPTLVLPGTPLNDGQLDYILRHETTHLRRLDLWYQWAAALVGCLHWYHPAMWYAARQIAVECEISCDMAVVRDMDRAQVRGYAETILFLLTGGGKPQPLTTGMAASCSLLQRRFLTMKRHMVVGKRISVLSAALAVLLTAVTVLAGGILAGLTADPYTASVANHGQYDGCDTITAFYGAFSQREFDVMKQYCTPNCVANFFGDGYVFGMTQASLLDYTIDPMEYAKSSNDMIVMVRVEMVPHEQSVYAPGQTQAAFYMILLRQPDGRYLIDEFATGL